MKLIEAIENINEKERKRKKEVREQSFKKSFKPRQEANPSEIKLIHVQSIFPNDDVVALKVKTGEPTVKLAIIKAVVYYLENGPDES